MFLDQFPEVSPGEIKVFEDEIQWVSCNKEWLSTQLSGLSDPPTYGELSAIPLATEGWQQIFDQWKDRTIIS